MNYNIKKIYRDLWGGQLHNQNVARVVSPYFETIFSILPAEDVEKLIVVIAQMNLEDIF